MPFFFPPVVIFLYKLSNEWLVDYVWIITFEVAPIAQKRQVLQLQGKNYSEKMLSHKNVALKFLYILQIMKVTKIGFFCPNTLIFLKIRIIMPYKHVPTQSFVDPLHSKKSGG